MINAASVCCADSLLSNNSWVGNDKSLIRLLRAVFKEYKRGWKDDNELDITESKENQNDARPIYPTVVDRGVLVLYPYIPTLHMGDR